MPETCVGCGKQRLRWFTRRRRSIAQEYRQYLEMALPHMLAAVTSLSIQPFYGPSLSPSTIVAVGPAGLESCAAENLAGWCAIVPPGFTGLVLACVMPGAVSEPVYRAGRY